MGDGQAIGATTPRLPLFVSAVVWLTAVIVVARSWEHIPHTVVTHWGKGCEPDGWSAKTIGSVFGISLIGLGMWLFMLVLGAIFTRSTPTQTRLGKEDETVSRLRATAITATSTGFTGIFAITIMTFSMIQIAGFYLGLGHLVPSAIIGGLIASLAGSWVLVVYLVQVHNRIEEAMHKSGVQSGSRSSDDGANYKWGIIYYNPNDPSVLVEKRFGVGVNFNYTTWQGKTFVAVVLVATAICLALPFLGWR